MVVLTYILTVIYILFVAVIATMLVWHAFEEKIIVNVISEEKEKTQVNKDAICNVIIIGVMLVALLLRMLLIK